MIHQSLMERHSLLQKVVKPVKGRLEILVPDGGINDHRPPGDLSFSSFILLTFFSTNHFSMMLQKRKYVCNRVPHYRKCLTHGLRLNA